MEQHVGKMDAREPCRPRGSGGAPAQGHGQPASSPQPLTSGSGPCGRAAGERGKTSLVTQCVSRLS